MPDSSAFKKRGLSIQIQFSIQKLNSQAQKLSSQAQLNIKETHSNLAYLGKTCLRESLTTYFHSGVDKVDRFSMLTVGDDG